MGYETKGSDFMAKIRALALAAVVYEVWRERNYRIFRQLGQSWLPVFTRVEELIRAAATWQGRSRTYTS